ncbi:MAG: hypothetical protein ACYC2I_11115 [Elusimicrobiales bacterium]
MQYEVLVSGEPLEKLKFLKELLEIANACRACAESLPDTVLEDPAAREKAKPWREFQRITGKPLFDTLLEIVRQETPSEVRELAGDIMAQLWHPSAVGRLLEDFEQHRDTLAEKPPMRIFRNLGRIGTEAAARALMWMWGTKWDADVVSALGMCRSEEAQDFILRQAAGHSSSYVRLVCLMYLVLPLTEEKEAFILNRLKSGTHDEQFVAIAKVKELGMVQAADTLIALRANNRTGLPVGEIDNALSALRAAAGEVLRK